MPIDISHLTVPQLKELQTKIEGELVTRQTEGKAALLKEFEEKAAAMGMTLSELMGSKAAKAKVPAKERAPVAIKYRDPNEPNNTWTGRGRAPKWVVELEEKGGKREKWLA